MIRKLCCYENTSFVNATLASCRDSNEVSARKPMLLHALAINLTLDTITLTSAPVDSTDDVYSTTPR